MKKNIVELVVETSRVNSIQNVVVALINENGDAMKDGGLITAGKLMFKGADKGVPDSMKFFTTHPFGKLLASGMLAVGCQVYNHERGGALVNAMYASAMDECIELVGAKVVQDALGITNKLHADSVYVNPKDLSERKVDASKAAVADNDGDTRFSTAIGKDAETKGKDLSPAPVEVKATSDADYWPAESKDLKEKNGKPMCGICHQPVKRNRLALVEPIGKTPVLACGGCREATNKTIAEAKKNEEAVAAVKAGEKEYFDNKAAVAVKETALETAERKTANFEAMLKADPEDEVTQAAVAGANKKVADLNAELLGLYDKIEAYEKKMGLAQSKSSSSSPAPDAAPGKSGALAKLGAKK